MSAPDRVDERLLAELQDLAAIALSREEAAALREKLQRIVEFLAEIDELEIPEPRAWEARSRLREDRAGPSLDHDLVLESSPEHRGRFFRVLPVLPGREPGGEGGSP